MWSKHGPCKASKLWHSFPGTLRLTASKNGMRQEVLLSGLCVPKGQRSSNSWAQVEAIAKLEETDHDHGGTMWQTSPPGAHCMAAVLSVSRPWCCPVRTLRAGTSGSAGCHPLPCITEELQERKPKLEASAVRFIAWLITSFPSQWPQWRKERQSGFIFI